MIVSWYQFTISKLGSENFAESQVTDQLTKDYFLLFLPSALPHKSLTMPNKHERKIIPNFLIGIGLVTAGILLIIYDVKSQLKQINKDLIIAGIVVLINGGLYFWGSAFVHKVKSDLIHRQKRRENKGVVEEL